MSADKNYEYFKQNLLAFLKDHRGQFVIIRNEKKLGYYSNLEDAL